MDASPPRFDEREATEGGDWVLLGVELRKDLAEL